MNESVSDSRVLPCGQMDGWIDMKKSRVAFRNFVKTLKKENPSSVLNYSLVCKIRAEIG